MRTERIALGAALVIGGLVAGSASAQEHRGTMEQQMACTPDVWRLCSSQIPDENRIVACLQANAPALSGACRAVFESNNQLPPPPPVQRGRSVPPRYNNVPPPPQQVQPRPYDDADD